MEGLEKIPEQSQDFGNKGRFAFDRKKESLNTVEKNVARILMESNVYYDLSPKERLDLIHSLEERFPGLEKHLNSENINA